MSDKSPKLDGETSGAMPVSVVIPAYNAHHTIQRAIDSVVEQLTQPLEILIVDDGSSPTIESALPNPSSLVRVIRQENGGAAAARNKGIDEARGDFIAFLDADDYWLPNKLTLHQQAFREHPELGMTFSRFFEQRPNDAFELPTKRIRMFPEFNRCRLYQGRDLFDVACCVWTGTVVARRDCIGNHRFQSGLEPAEDRAFWIRILENGPTMCLEQALAVAVLEPGSLSRTHIDRDCQNMLRVINMTRATLGWRGTWWWKRRTFRRWASEYLGANNSAAWRPALRRWCYEPWSPEAAWIVMKSFSKFAQRENLGQVPETT